MLVIEKAPPEGVGKEQATLTNYEDSHIFLSGGFGAGGMYCPRSDVQMYDIEHDSWKQCPERPNSGANHSSLCLKGKFYIFYGSHGGMCGSAAKNKDVERFDAQAFIGG